jgi:hypothetical protein
MTTPDRLRVHVDALGPVLLLNPTLLHPTLPTAAGQPMDTPVYGARCLIPNRATEQQLRRYVELVRAGIWLMGHPQQFIDPIRDATDIDHGPGWFFYAASLEAPRLYREHQGRAVDFRRWDDRGLIEDMAPALVSITLEAAQTVPWCGGVDVTLQSVLLLDRQPSASADSQLEAFNRALSGAPTSAQEARS